MDSGDYSTRIRKISKRSQMGIVFIAVVSAVIIIIFVASLYSALSIGPFNFSSSNPFGSNEPPP